MATAIFPTTQTQRRVIMNKIKQWAYFTWLCICGKISSEILQNAINASREAGEKNEPALKWQSDKLRYVNSVTTDPQTNLNFLEFFQTKEGLYVWETFRANILKYVQGIVETIEPITAYYFDLKERMSDSEIDRELPKGYEFGLIEGLTLILWLLLKQWGGKDGSLLNTDYRANIFHLKILGYVAVVRVYWNADSGRWFVNDWKFGELGRWDAAYRVFSCQPV
ncbi:MAG: hypothetical protein PHT88_04120 [Candidatus Moranbacteria bacterium]|nr:hypothetical protein [Candidatus Moranbacteria bacterium]